MISSLRTSIRVTINVQKLSFYVRNFVRTQLWILTPETLAPAARLVNPAVHVEVDVAAPVTLALHEGVGVHHVHEHCIVRGQLLVPIAGDEEGQRGVQP